MHSYFFKLKTALVLAASAMIFTGCYTPATSQKYFVEASMNDPALEPIYSTSLYTVYFDYALVRCVIHSTHTWGQQGGGGGGTGIGIAAFRCDPNRVRNRAESVGLKTYPAKMSPAITPTRRPPSVKNAPPASIESGSPTSSPTAPAGGIQ